MSNGAHLRLARTVEQLAGKCEKFDLYVRDAEKLLADYNELHETVLEMADNMDRLEQERDAVIALLTDIYETDGEIARPVIDVTVQESML